MTMLYVSEVVRSFKDIFLSKQVGGLLLFTLILFVYQCWPVLIFRIFGLPFENFVYFVLIIFLIANFFRFSLDNYLLILFFLITFLCIYGYVFNGSHEYYSKSILFRELKDLLAIPIGYMIGKIYTSKKILTLFISLYILGSLIIVMSFPLYDFGLIKSLNGERKFLPNQFFAIGNIYTLLPAFLLFAKNEKSRFQYILTWALYILVFVFAIRSATRGVILLGSLSLVLSCYFTKNMLNLIFVLVVSLPAIWLFGSNTLLAERILNKEKSENSRLVELETVLDDFKHNGNYLLGFGIGVGTLNPYAVGWRDNPVNVSPHIGFVTPLYKGGVLFFLLYLYPGILAIYSLLINKNTLLKCFSILMLFCYFQAMISGGYIFSHMLIYALIFSILKHYRKWNYVF